MKKLLKRVRGLFSRGKLETEMAEEMRLHLERRVEENIASGMTPEEARYAALRKFGGVEQAKEVAREQRGFAWLEQAGQDVRFGLRGLAKAPGFAVVVILTLALGIGATTAIFTLLNALMLRALPVAEPGRLVQVQSLNGDESFSYVTFQRFRDQARTLAGIAILQRGFDKRGMIASGMGGTEAESVNAQAVSGSTFGVLGVPAALGRPLTVEDDAPGKAQPVAVLSHAYWQRRFGGDAGVLGKTVQIDGVLLTIVGVMREGFAGFHVGVPVDLWWPMELYPELEKNPNASGRLASEGWEWALLVGRLKPAVTREQAAAELQTIFFRQRSDHARRATKFTEKERADFLARTIELVPAGNGFAALRKRLMQPLAVLSWIVGLVLLIACANVAGLLLARGAARERELAVRAALGAGRGRIARQLITESLLLAVLGGGAGLVVAQWGTAFLKRYLLDHPHGMLDLSPDLRMLGFAGGMSVLTGVVFGLVPALRLSRGALHVSTKAAAGGRSRLNQALVVTQIALSVAILALAGLFVRSLQKLKAVDLGFRPEKVVRFVLEFGRGYDAQQRGDVHRRVLEAVEALPQVRSATVSGAGLFGGDGFGIRFGVEGYVPKPGEDLRALVVVAGPAFFETLGIPLRVGRG
ncbi:MAG: ABC transporter permease, partial [Verrucomicrobiota bacterium]